MEGSHRDLEGAPGVTSNSVSPASASPVCTGSIPLRQEKHCCAWVEEPETDNGSLEAQICTDFSKSVNLGVKKGLQKSSTFPPSAGDAEQGDDSTRHAEELMKDAAAYARSVSLPPTLKLISAMKGSRQKNGMAAPTENRRVKWDPDVYDPPVTSVCHSVGSSYRYQRRSKHHKKEKNKEKNKQKKKQQKTKSKKGHQNSIQSSTSVLQTPDIGLEDVSTLHGLGKHEALTLDYSVGKEAKCGSSFLRESVAKMHFSITEAS